MSGSEESISNNRSGVLILADYGSNDSEAEDANIEDAIANAPPERLRSVLLSVIGDSDRARKVATSALLVDSTQTTGKRKRYETCINCLAYYEVEKNGELDCKYHPGTKEVEYEAETWDDHNWDVHGEPETLAELEEYAGGFTWTCCGVTSDQAVECVVFRHEPAPSKRARIE